MKYWLRYSKGGSLRFVGHLDMLQAWERILRRARVPLVFSQGFSPRPVLSLAAPLPVGLRSEAEYLELETRSEEPDLLKMIIPVLPRDMELMGCTSVPPQTKSLMGLIRFGDYTVPNLTEEQVAWLNQCLPRFLAATSVVQEVKRKGGRRNVDIRPLVRSAILTGDTLQLCLAVGSVANLRVEDLLRYWSLPVSELTVIRQELYLLQGEELVTPFQYKSR